MVEFRWEYFNVVSDWTILPKSQYGAVQVLNLSQKKRLKIVKVLIKLFFVLKASIDRVLADVGIAPVDTVLKSAAAHAAAQASLTPR